MARSAAGRSRMEARHPACVAVDAVAALAASPLFAGAVGDDRSAALSCLAAQVGACLAPAPPGQAASRQQQDCLEALYGLARECLALASAFDSAEAPEEDGDDCEVVVAEVAVNGLAAFASGLLGEEADAGYGAPPHVSEYLERLGHDLDQFSAHLFSGLSRFSSGDGVACASGHWRLLRALRDICVWSFAALGRGIGHANLSAAVVWEWAQHDALWALVLAKGALTACPPEGLPELPQLQGAILFAVLGLPSADVAFAAAPLGGGDVPIASRNEELVRHRAALAWATVKAQVLPTLVNASGHAGALAAAPALVAFLVALLQPEVTADAAVDAGCSPAAAEAAAEVLLGGEATPEALAALTDGRQAAATLRAHLAPMAGAMWDHVAESAAAATLQVGEPRRGRFFQDCAALAYFLPPPAHCMHRLFWAGGSGGEASVLAALCFVGANAGISPGDSGPLAPTLLALSGEAKAAVAACWERWRGPIRLDVVAQWAEMLEVPDAVPVAGSQPPPLELAPPEAPGAPPAPPPPARGRGTALQEIVAEAPAEYRCAYDGQLMMDPVRSPYGQVFERAALAHALAALGGLCPSTGAPLALEDCVRLPELRRQIAAWVRQRRVARRE